MDVGEDMVKVDHLHTVDGHVISVAAVGNKIGRYHKSQKQESTNIYIDIVLHM